jgi:spore germination protein GerM
MPAKVKTKKTLKNVKAKSAPKTAEKKYAHIGTGKHVYVLIIMILITVIFIIINTKNDNILKFMNITDKKSEDKKTDISKEKKKETKDEEKPDAEKELSEVKVFFIKINESSEKIILTPVERNVKKGAELENAFIELIKGPTQKEKKNGILTAFPENVKLRKVSVKNGIAEIDFSSAIESGSGSDILMSRIDQIIWTATQIEGVKGVLIKINGKTRATLGNEGISISGVLTRNK